jgi:hypothetical protein
MSMICGIICFVPGYTAHASECRTAALPDGTPAMFCKDKSGKWKQQAGRVVVAPVVSSAPSVPLSAEANYRGTAIWLIPIKQRATRARNLTDLVLNGIAQTTKKEEILVSMTMSINGPSVTGHLTGGGWRTNVPLSGTRKDGICNISATYNGTSITYLGKCDASGFVGQMNQYNTGAESLKGSFRLDAISFADNSRRDAERAALQKQCDAGKNTACVALEQMK